MTNLGPLAGWVDDPAGAVLCTDFDGTLSPIVADAASAAPLPGAASVLRRLSAHLGLVAVVSGRPARFLRDRLGDVGPRVRLVGLYGMQWVEDGRVRVAEDVAPWVPVVAGVVAEARGLAPPGVDVEDKDASVVLHWRTVPEHQGWVEARAARWAEATGLAVQPARMALELRPPVPTDKGSAVRRLASSARAAAFAGDDAGDLAAFDALDELQAAGCRTTRVVVADRETPEALVARADMLLDGPVAFLGMLGRLADALDASRARDGCDRS